MGLVCAGEGLVVWQGGPGIFLQGLDTYSSSGIRLPSKFIPCRSKVVLNHIHSACIEGQSLCSSIFLLPNSCQMEQ